MLVVEALRHKVHPQEMVYFAPLRLRVIFISRNWADSNEI